eukprot:1157816-Pelagomonas_calceolata.AAC.1
MPLKPVSRVSITLCERCLTAGMRVQHKLTAPRDSLQGSRRLVSGVLRIISCSGLGQMGLLGMTPLSWHKSTGPTRTQQSGACGWVYEPWNLFKEQCAQSKERITSTDPIQSTHG